MILNMEKGEMAVLVLHMTIMRKSVRTGFKKRYDSKERKEVLASYDEVKGQLSEILKLDDESAETPEGPKEIHFNIKEVDMLDAFLGWYNKEVDESIGEKKIHQNDKEQLDILKEVKEKLDGLRMAYA